MKRRMFIGSSKEGLEIAKRLKSTIKKHHGTWIEINLWNENDVFTLNAGTLESLIKASLQYDYALLVATSDDIIISREEQKPAARDNVIFEAGLFMGALGKDRTFIVANKTLELPSDFNGTTICLYSHEKELEKECSPIINSLENTKHSYQLRHLPSAALAMGYFDNYIKQFCTKRKSCKLNIIIPSMFTNIESEIDKYKTKNSSKINIPFSKSHRPIGYKYKNKKKEYWDIPTTLQTIYKLIDKITAQREIGKNEENNDWLKRELLIFASTLTELIKEENLSDKVFVLRDGII